MMLGVIFTTMTALLHDLRRGRLYIIGGRLISLGVFSVLLELFIWITFLALGVLRMMLMIIAIVKPFKESLQRYFYMSKMSKRRSQKSDCVVLSMMRLWDSLLHAALFGGRTFCNIR